MKIQTFSVLVGSAACNAHCPYCVAKMTPLQGVDLKLSRINWRNFSIGCRFAKENNVDQQVEIKCFLETEGKRLLPLAHGAVVYDLYGQNICLSDCLTENPSPEEVRQLIFFPDGHLRYDWQHEGAILL